MWGDTTLRLAWEATLICMTFKSLTCHQNYRTGNGQEYRQVNLITIKQSKYADLSSLTYHQHYPALETDKSIGRPNLNAWPWKPHLSPRRWVSQHRIGQDYWQVHKWKGQNTAQSLGEVATRRLNRQPQRRWPQVYWQTKTSSTQGGRVGIFVTFGTKLTEYSTPPKGSAFTLNNGSFIARHDYGCNQ